MIGLAVMTAGGCARDHGVRALRAAVPSLEPELAQRSCTDGPADWRAYCRRLGPRRLMDAIEVLQDTLMFQPTLASFVRVRPAAEHCLLRLAEGIASEFDYPAPLAYARRCRARSDAADFALSSIRLAYHHANIETRGAEVRLARTDSLAARYASMDEPLGVESVQLTCAQLELETGHRDRFRARLEAARALAIANRDDYLQSQILGQLGNLHEAAGHDDSMQVCFTEGLALARAHGFTDQVERFLLFEAGHAGDEGRFAFAADRLAEAVEAVEGAGDRNDRLRLTIRQARFFAGQDSWDEVERTLRRFPVLLRDHQRFDGPEAEKLALDVDLLRARMEFADGRAAEAVRRLEPWLGHMAPQNERLGFAQLDDVWSEGLMNSGDWVGTLRSCERGLAHCDRTHVAEVAVPLAFRRARALEALGRLSDARGAAVEAVGRLSSLSSDDRRPWLVAADVLEARLRLRSGDLAGGRSLLRHTLAAAGGATSSRTIGPAEAAGLSIREAVHELARLSPAQGYAFELAWRSRTRRGGSRSAVDPFSSVPLPDRGTHLVYHFTGDRLLRWCATRGTVRLDSLPVRARDCLAEVREALTLLRTEAPGPSRCLGPRAEQVLRRLGAELLPRDLGGAGAGHEIVEISPDGPLLSLPFEALVLGDAQGTPPLGLVADVAYTSGWATRPARPEDTAVIVSNPAIPPDVRRRYAWSGPLLGSEAEARCALLRWPQATVLRGRAATRARTLRLAASASHLYIAAHHVRDPGASFLGFLPLAPDSGEAPGEALIEAADIRGLDLSDCRLAVLASCASGAPDRLAERPGPSLGDAFLDAGAHAVVRSFWDVGDEETRAFMERFLDADSAQVGTVRALATARRAAMRDAPPRVWAAWSVAVTRELPAAARTARATTPASAARGLRAARR